MTIEHMYTTYNLPNTLRIKKTLRPRNKYVHTVQKSSKLPLYA